MGDDELRAQVATVPLPQLEGQPFTPLAQPLARSTVAIVTTAALHRSDDRGYADRDDESFRIFGRGDEGLRLGHLSQNYDRSGYLTDPNVVLPLDRLDDLVADGLVGAVADEHISFLGAVRGDLETIRLDSGPRAARRLRDAGVDLVVLTPVCPMCTRTVCVLARTLEEQGLTTVALSLVRPHAEGLRPPRALQVDFPFGRPLGRPNDPALQRRVLLAALALTGRPTGPVLEDFPEAVESPSDAPSLACVLPPAVDGEASPAVAEARGLAPAYGRGVAHNAGRTAVGTGTDPGRIPQLLGRIEDVLASAAGADVPAELGRWCLDVRAYYEVAGLQLAAEQGRGSGDDVSAWFYRDTRAGRVICATEAHLRSSGQPEPVWRFLVPHGHRWPDANDAN